MEWVAYIVGKRESRRLLGDVILRQQDIEEHRPYPIPYRCFYSRDVDNLFMAGRNISVTHVPLDTVRVMNPLGMVGESMARHIGYDGGPMRRAFSRMAGRAASMMSRTSSYRMVRCSNDRR